MKVIMIIIIQQTNSSSAAACLACLCFSIHPYTYTSLQPTFLCHFIHNSNIHNNSNKYGETFSSYLLFLSFSSSLLMTMKIDIFHTRLDDYNFAELLRPLNSLSFSSGRQASARENGGVDRKIREEEKEPIIANASVKICWLRKGERKKILKRINRRVGAEEKHMKSQRLAVTVLHILEQEVVDSDKQEVEVAGFHMELEAVARVGEENGSELEVAESVGEETHVELVAMAVGLKEVAENDNEPVAGVMVGEEMHR